MIISTAHTAILIRAEYYLANNFQDLEYLFFLSTVHYSLYVLDYIVSWTFKVRVGGDVWEVG